MKFKYLNNYKGNIYSTLFYLKKEIPKNSIYDLSSEEIIKNQKINEQNFNEAFTKGLNENIKESNANDWSIIKTDNLGITKLNFSLICQNESDKKDSIKNFDLSRNQINKENIIKTKTKRGRKRKREEKNDESNTDEKNYHDKFSDDNLRKKCKNLVLKYVMEFINEKIKEKYKNNIGHGKFKKELKILDQKFKVNTKISVEKSFLTKTLREIFSGDISSKNNNLPKEFNKVLIEALLEDNNDVERKLYFNKLFNITFLDCLKYFREDKKACIEELKGFKTVSDIKDILIRESGQEYVDILIVHLKAYETEINNKKERKRKNKIEDKI